MKHTPLTKKNPQTLITCIVYQSYYNNCECMCLNAWILSILNHTRPIICLKSGHQVDRALHIKP